MSLAEICKPLIRKIDERAFLYPKDSDQNNPLTTAIRKQVNKEIRKAVKNLKQSPDYLNYQKLEPWIRKEGVEELDRILPPWSRFQSDQDTEEAIHKCASKLFNAQQLDSTKLKDDLGDALERLEKDYRRRARGR